MKSTRRSELRLSLGRQVEDYARRGDEVEQLVEFDRLEITS